MKYFLKWAVICLPLAVLYAFVSHQMGWPDWWGYVVGGVLGIGVTVCLEGI